MKSLAILALLMHCQVAHQWDVVTQSKGEVWPLPQNQTTLADFLSLDAASFQFVYDGPACQILNQALLRYTDLIFHPPRLTSPSSKSDHQRQDRGRPKKTDKRCTGDNFSGDLQSLNVVLFGQCEDWPHHDMDEKYNLNIATSDNASLNSSTVWGLLRGLETFSQLIYHDQGNNLVINVTSILDFPRFSHRGVMLDTSRHYVTKSVILKNLDAMSYTKYNVFHWHIVDDPSFPYQSASFPDLSEKGAYVPATHIYAMNDIVEIIDYARVRGIRVIVEFDTPFHDASWGPGEPQLLTQCYKNMSGVLVPDGFGPLDPSSNATYEFLRQFFAEIGRLFNDDYLHVGGNDVTFDCWKSNPAISSFMESQGFGSDYGRLHNYYTKNLLDVVDASTTIVWQDAFDGDVDLKPQLTVVHVWKNDSMSELANVTASGYRALLSSCWLLSDFKMANDWIDFYPCEPLAFNGTDEQKSLVVGGETCLWGEFVDGTNLVTRLWPRAFAPAERLWSDATVNNHTQAVPRFEEHRCRLVARGINAEPVNGPCFCPSDYLV